MKAIKNLIESIKVKNKFKKKICFFLGNTKKKESRRYFFTPIRENKNFIFFGAVVYNNSISRKILKNIDGKVDFIFVDIEKKIKSKDKTLKLVNIERVAKDVVKKSKLYVYKANDLAVSATETLLNNFFLKDKRGLGGKKLLILGIGNIGFKLALKFVESGSIVYIFRRKKNLLNIFAKTINKIKPKGTISKVKVLNRTPNDLSFYDIVISSADRNNIINFNQVKNISKKTILIDVGKGNFSNEATRYLEEKNMIIYRLDTTSSYFSYLENVVFTQNQYKKIKFKKKIKNFKFVSQGIVGQKNDIIVDNIITPKKVLGVCDGEGGLFSLNFNEKNKLIKNINKISKLKLAYD